MVTYIVITNNKQYGDLSTSKPFFSHEEAEKEMWNQFAKVTKMSVDEAKAYAKNKSFAYGDYYINTLICECEIHSILFSEPNYVYRVSAYYDMDIMTDEEIIQEIYATEELAQKRVRQLIDTYKNVCHAIEDCEPYGGEWDEDEYRLYAYMDSEWNVDISYIKEEVRTNC